MPGRVKLNGSVGEVAVSGGILCLQKIPFYRHVAYHGKNKFKNLKISSC